MEAEWDFLCSLCFFCGFFFVPFMFFFLCFFLGFFLSVLGVGIGSNSRGRMFNLIGFFSGGFFFPNLFFEVIFLLRFFFFVCLFDPLDFHLSACSLPPVVLPVLFPLLEQSLLITLPPYYCGVLWFWCSALL